MVTTSDRQSLSTRKIRNRVSGRTPEVASGFCKFGLFPNRRVGSVALGDGDGDGTTEGTPDGLQGRGDLAVRSPVAE